MKSFKKVKTLINNNDINNKRVPKPIMLFFSKILLNKNVCRKKFTLKKKKNIERLHNVGT